MMQTTDLGNRHDLSNRLDRPGIWRIFFQGQMTSRIEVVADVSFQCPSQMPLSKDGHVIETLSADPTNEPFRKWILPWTSCCGEHLVNAHSLNLVPEMATVNSVTVPNQISRHNIDPNGYAESLPRLGWFFASLRHQARDRALRDFKAEFEKFTVNTRRAPRDVRVGHGPDQRADVRTHWRSSWCFRLRESPPIPIESILLALNRV